MKENSTFPWTPDLELHHKIQFSVIPRILIFIEYFFMVKETWQTISRLCWTSGCICTIAHRLHSSVWKPSWSGQGAWKKPLYIFKIWSFNLLAQEISALSAGAEEYIYYTSAEGEDPINRWSGYDAKLSDGEAPVLEIWWMWSASFIAISPRTILILIGSTH